MDTPKSSAHAAHDPHPEVAAGDPFIAAAIAGHRDQERPHGCYEGVVFLGELVEDPDTGEEVEVVHPYPCRRCGGTGQISH